MFSRQLLQTGRREMFRSGSLQIRQSPGKRVANRLSIGTLRKCESVLCLWLAGVGALARVRSPILLLKTTLLQTNREQVLGWLVNRSIALILVQINRTRTKKRTLCVNFR